jgi:AraC-like DNA-binding protein/predicted transcriptional regulator YdeE
MLKELTINALLNYIDENIEKKALDINELVVFSGYSRRYLQLLFSKNVGIPVGKYIQRRRITRASLLLRLTRLSIVTISEKLFYDSQQTFTREFKKNTGYTPLQYRNNNIWTFKHQTGHREMNNILPNVIFRHLPNIEFYGESASYVEKIPYTGKHSRKKWDTVKSTLSQTDSPLFISNSIYPGRKDKEEFLINSIFWTKRTPSDKKENIAEGVYAYFTYKGQIKDYISYINNIYLNVMSHYGLQKRNTYDLEIISKTYEDDFFFEYYLPVDDDNPVIHNLVHRHDSTDYVTDIRYHAIISYPPTD